MPNAKQAGKLLLLALKIAIGSSLAIYLAHVMQLEYAAAAGSITLLTVLTTKWETVRLSIYRLITFLITVVLLRVTFEFISIDWLAYGVYMLLLVLICGILDWKNTISVNAVIGTHFLLSHDFSTAFLYNELMLVLLGITIAFALNLVHNYTGDRKSIIANMRRTEDGLQLILRQMAAYLSCEEVKEDVWQNIRTLETEIQSYIQQAYEYQENTFQSHPQYYIDYFEMRSNQCSTLHNLHYEMKKIRNIPKQAGIVARYMLYMADYVVEINVPTQQLRQLELLMLNMAKDPLPQTREEFEGQAMLYHILMDLEDFLRFKRRFVEQLSGKTLALYWQKGVRRQDR